MASASLIIKKPVSNTFVLQEITSDTTEKERHGNAFFILHFVSHEFCSFCASKQHVNVGAQIIQRRFNHAG